MVLTPDVETTTDTVLTLEGVSKRFGAVQALRDVDLECRAGEIHAVLGENGSGKSTLLGVASGIVRPDRGTVHIGGHRLHVGHAADARRLGLAMAYQTYSHVTELTVAENLYLAVHADDRPPLRRVNPWAAEQLDRFDVDVDPRRPLGELSLAERQLLEVVKALLEHPRTLLLDEPTTALGPGEVDRLHELVEQQARAGVGVLYVSHRLTEVLEIADRVTVLRDGESQGTHDTADLSEGDLVAMMIGRPAELAFPARDVLDDGDRVVLAAEGLRGDRFGPVDLRLRRGEILGIAGAEGNGQDELIRALAGVAPASGSVRLEGREVDVRSPRAALGSGIAFLSGERLVETLFPVLSVRANTSIQILRRVSRFGLLRRRREADAVSGTVADLAVRATSIEQPVRLLSGGNQQKVALGRSLLRGARVLVVEEPTQGVDVASRFDIYGALRALAAEGAAVVVRSSDPIELSGLCDRVVVVSRGRIVRELPTGELSEESIVSGIVGSGARPAGVRPDGGPQAGEGSPAAPGASPRPWRGVARAYLPILALAGLIVGVGGYTAGQSDAFLSDYNLRSLLLATLPLALASMGQVNALLVRGFDVSVGALMALAVVVGSFVLTGESFGPLALGSAAILGVGLLAGGVNVVLIARLGVPSIIATLATLSVMQGIALVLRPTPGGTIGFDFADLLTTSVGFVPVALLVVFGLAVAGDVWLHHSGGGLAARAAGFDEAAAGRLGIDARRVATRAFLATSLLATVGAFFLAAQTGVGDARLAGDFALVSIAAAVLGGASLAGGRGSFVGAIVAALFLTLITNVLPFLGWSSAYGDIAKGLFIVAALVAYKVAGTRRAGRGRLFGRRSTPSGDGAPGDAPF
ncbi:MAG TPA: ATP-binding cassette domain-containing protein [Acidimicrobiales bacterium]